MIKFLIEIFLFYILYRIIRELLFGDDDKPKKKTFRREEPQSRPNGDFRRQEGPVDPPRAREELVQDPVCGVYIPKSSALASDGSYFCSKECLEAHKRKG